MKTIDYKRFCDIFGVAPTYGGVELFNDHIKKYGKEDYRKDAALRPEEQTVLYTLCSWLNPTSVVETGTNQGASTTVLALALMSSPEHDTILHTYDVPDAKGGKKPELRCSVDTNRWGYVFRGTPIENYLIAHNKDTLTLNIDNVPEAEFWFIDSAHDYNVIKHETELAMSILNKHKPNRGMIVWHDAKPKLAWRSDVYQYLMDNEHLFRNCLVEPILVETDTGMAFVVV